MKKRNFNPLVPGSIARALACPDSQAYAIGQAWRNGAPAIVELWNTVDTRIERTNQRMAAKKLGV